jgi:hypothetical protein
VWVGCRRPGGSQAAMAPRYARRKQQ